MENEKPIKMYILEILEKYDTLSKDEIKDMLERIFELFDKDTETLGEENYYEGI